MTDEELKAIRERAAARSDIPKLLDYIEELERAVKMYQETLCGYSPLVAALLSKAKVSKESS